MSERDETTQTSETTAVATETVRATPAAEADAATPATATVEVARLREYVVRTNPEAVPELITGASLEEMEASVPVAKAAFERIAQAARAGAQQGTAAAIEQAQQAAQGAPVPPVVPAGGATLVVDPASIPSGEKIRLGLKGQGR